MIQRIESHAPRAPSPLGSEPGTGPASPEQTGSTFADALSEARGGELQLSAHAARRLDQRGIALGDEARSRLVRALDTLAGKGAQTSLVMLEGVAYVVHVPSQTVVTAVRPSSGKEAVFTQIDSVVVA